MRNKIMPMLIAGILGYILSNMYLMGVKLTELYKDNRALEEELTFINEYFKDKYRLNATTYIMNEKGRIR